MSFIWVVNARSHTLIVANVLGGLPSAIAFIAIGGTVVGIAGYAYDTLYPLVRSQVIPGGRSTAPRIRKKRDSRVPIAFLNGVG